MKSPCLFRALVRVRWAGQLVLAALTLAGPSLAAAKSVQGNRYDVTLTAADNGTFHVSERLQATFTATVRSISASGTFRWIGWGRSSM